MNNKDKDASRCREVFVSQRDNGLPLVRFLARETGCSNRRAKHLLDERRVWVNQRRIWMARHILRTGDRVRVLPPSGGGKILVLCRAADLWIINKPPGIAANGSADSAEAAMQRKTGLKLQAVHRLDVDTSGCLLLAHGEPALAAAQDLFRRREVEKIYWAILVGRIEPDNLRSDRRIAGKSAVTEIQVMQRSRRASLVEVRLQTGRTHQVRRHAAGMRHPVAGDKQYGPTMIEDNALRNIPRQMLHARSLRLTVNDQGLSARAPLPYDFRDTANMLGLPVPG